jgi:hypothetical protein
METQAVTVEGPSRERYLLAALFDIAFGVGVVLAVLGGDETGPYAIVALLGYGLVVTLFSQSGRQIFKSLKGAGLVGAILMLLLIGVVAPIIHLLYSIVKFFQTPPRERPLIVPPPLAAQDRQPAHYRGAQTVGMGENPAQQQSGSGVQAGTQPSFFRATSAPLTQAHPHRQVAARRPPQRTPRANGRLTPLQKAVLAVLMLANLAALLLLGLVLMGWL